MFRKIQTFLIILAMMCIGVRVSANEYHGYTPTKEERIRIEALKNDINIIRDEMLAWGEKWTEKNDIEKNFEAYIRIRNTYESRIGALLDEIARIEGSVYTPLP